MVAHHYAGRPESCYRYDDTGRVTEQVNPEGLDYRFEYGESRVIITDSLNRREVLYTEGEGGLKRVVKKEHADGSITRSEYDEAGRLKALHSFFFFEDAEDHAGNSTVAFTIRDGRLFTLRERELPAFRLYRMRARSQSMVDGNAYELLLDLFETKIEQLADEIENIYSDLEQLSRVIMEGHQGDEYDEALSTLAELEDIGWKVRLCLMDTQRALNFLVRKARLPGGQLEQAREILRDIESLLPHNESLFQKVNFLMQAAMGFINIEQNRIIKIFSVVSVVFLPPTLVASSYGMNFEFMPELKWSFGYPAAIIFMILAGLAPYLYFKRKNWL